MSCLISRFDKCGFFGKDLFAGNLACRFRVIFDDLMSLVSEKIMDIDVVR